MQEFIKKSIDIVKGYLGSNISDDEIFVLWSCKTLQNMKVLLSASFKGSTYFEITYNGNKDEIYLDVYKKKKTYVVLS